MNTVPAFEPLRPGQSLVTTKQLAGIYQVCRATIWHWTVKKPAFRDAQFTRGRYSVQKLRDAGVLTKEHEEKPAASEEVAHVG